MVYGNTSKTPTTQPNITLPSKIRCQNCHKLKGHFCYSAKRLDQLRAALRSRPDLASERAEFISCCSCTCEQQFEFECHVCDRVLPRKLFSGAQLKGANRDTATCNKCMAERLNDDAGNESSGSGAGSDDSDDSEDSHTAGTRTVAGTFSGLSLGNTTSGYGSSAGGVPLASVNSSRAPSTIGAKSTTPSGPTTPSRRTSPPHLRNRLTSASTTSNNSNFAKVRGAGPVQKHYADATRRHDEWEAGKKAKEREDALDEVEVQDSDSDEDED